MRRRATMMLSVFSKEEEGQDEVRVLVVGKKHGTCKKILRRRVVGCEEKETLVAEEEQEEEDEVNGGGGEGSGRWGGGRDCRGEGQGVARVEERRESRRGWRLGG
jgi:hypothetical protein